MLRIAGPSLSLRERSVALHLSRREREGPATVRAWEGEGLHRRRL